MKEEQVIEEVDELQQNQRQVSSDYADHNAQNGQRNYSQIGREIS
jgi:hypothetical protein